MKISGKKTGKCAFEIDQAGHKYTLDAPISAGGEDLGPSPKGLLLSGLIGCTGVDISLILEKMRSTYEDLQITAEAEVTEEYPQVFQDIFLTYAFTCKKPDPKKIIQAVELSLGKYCGVSAMLAKNSPIHHQIYINGEKI